MTAKEERDARLATQLRDNLKKRKDQQRANPPARPEDDVTR